MLGLITILLLLSQPVWSPPASSSSSPDSHGPTRRVNMPYLQAYQNDDAWERSAIFWLGINQQGLPSKNYADVRMHYRQQYLEVRVTIIDYYLWYAPNPTSGDDLTQYDGVAIYLDTNHDRANRPQPDDRMFLLAARREGSPAWVEYTRQARGTGSGWDKAWHGSWQYWWGMDWGGPGPNDNSGEVDYGWTAGFRIPWESLGSSGPPVEGTIWGLGVMLYDRDDRPPAGAVPIQHWPESFDASVPATWAELHFGYDDYQAPPTLSQSQGTTMIRANSPRDNIVEDAWMGGGGQCSGGRFGGGVINHGDDKRLFAGTETRSVHLPCFNKSYLRFSLAGIPSNKTIVSANMTLHLWGNAYPSLAQPSWVHVFSIKDPWQEMAIHWNNAPLAYENISATWVNPYPNPQNIVWPGDPYTWDVTKAVAEAYRAGEPVSLAIYGSDTEEHSSKYLTSSEEEDWNAAGRPTLHVTWGVAAGDVQKSVTPLYGDTGDMLTFTLQIVGSGTPLSLVDTLPAGLGAPVSMDAGLHYAAGQITWNGTPASGQVITLRYAVPITTARSTTLENKAILKGSDGFTTSDTAVVIANRHRTYLPVVQ